MPVPNPAALDFLLNRRSRPAKTLGLPVPDDVALEPILRAALRSPDHGKLEPWRLIVLTRPALLRMAGLVPGCEAALDRDAEDIAKQQRQFADAHLAVAVISSAAPSIKIPEFEQILSAGAVCTALLNAALAAGWGANWLSGWASHDPGFAREAVGIAPPERIAGLIHIGTETAEPPERPRPDPATKIAWLTR